MYGLCYLAQGRCRGRGPGAGRGGGAALGYRGGGEEEE